MKCWPLILLLLFPSAHATTQQNEQALRTVNQQIKALTARLDRDQTKASRLQKDLKLLDLAIAQIALKQQVTESQLKEKQIRLLQLKAQFQRDEEQLKAQQAHLAEQIQAAYFLRQDNAIKLLLNQEDPSKISRLLHDDRALNQARLDQLAQIRMLLDQTLNDAASIEQETKDLKALEEQQRHEHDTLVQAQLAQQKVIISFHATLKTDQDHLNELLDNKKALEGVIHHVQKNLNTSSAFNLPNIPFAKLQGQLPWPTAGKIVRHYGSSLDQDDRLKLNAILIGAPRGQAVYAVAPGKVIFSDWLRGLGLLIIIDHGNGYLSLYGYNQSLYHKTGDLVSAGEQIASVGESGGQSQTALYFGLRENITPLDPQVWLRGLSS